MPIDPKTRDGHTEFDKKFLKIIDEHGWHVMNVAPRTDQEGDLWSYSTGLFIHYKHPEIVIFNQRADLRQSMINSIGDRVKTGETFEPGKGYSDIIGNFDLQFRPMYPSRYWDWLNFACWFYDNDPTASPFFSAFIQTCTANSHGSPDARSGRSSNNHSTISPNPLIQKRADRPFAKARTCGQETKSPKGHNYSPRPEQRATPSSRKAEAPKQQNLLSAGRKA
jgi:uncharacterized protein DUF4262